MESYEKRAAGPVVRNECGVEFNVEDILKRERSGAFKTATVISGGESFCPHCMTLGGGELVASSRHGQLRSRQT